MATLSGRWLVAGVFGTVLASCVSQATHDEVIAYNQKLEHQRARDQEQLAQQRQQLAKDQEQLAQAREQRGMDESRISRLQSGIKHTVESDLLFETGSWELSDAGKKTISTLAAKLAPTQENKLVVIGYTDNVPVGPGLEEQGISSNDELSLRRAEAVREFLISKGFDPDIVSAKGRGEANPVAGNATAKGRSKNRRVELSLGG